MTATLDPYLAAIRSHLGKSLASRTGSISGDDLFGHRILTQLLVKSQVLPALHEKALRDFVALMEELTAELSPMSEGLVLTGRLMQHIRVKPDYREAEAAVQSAIRLLLPKPTDRRRALMKKISAITFAVHEGVRQAVQDQEVKPAATAAIADPLSPTQKQALQKFLRQKFTDESTLEIGAAKALTGGGSKQTLQVDLKNTKALPPAVVLRIDKAEGVTGSQVADEFTLISAMYEAGMPVPKPYAVEPGSNVLGAPFIVVSKVEGHNIGDPLQVFEPSRSVAIDIAQAMAKMHQIPLERVGDRIQGLNTSASERVRENMARFEGNWRAFGYTSIALEQAYAWLKEHIAFADGKRAILHCDIGAHNLLVHEDRLAALLDWETTVIGNPAQDLAYVHTMIVQMMPWEEFVAEYVKAGGDPPEAAAFDFYRLWSAAWKMNFLMITRSIFESGIANELLIGYSSQHMLQRGEYDLHEMVKLVYERY